MPAMWRKRGRAHVTEHVCGHKQPEAKARDSPQHVLYKNYKCMFIINVDIAPECGAEGAVSYVLCAVAACLCHGIAFLIITFLLFIYQSS